MHRLHIQLKVIICFEDEISIVMKGFCEAWVRVAVVQRGQGEERVERSGHS